MIGGVELNPGDASISLLLVKVSQVAFLLTFVIVCQDSSLIGGVKHILAMPVFSDHIQGQLLPNISSQIQIVLIWGAPYKAKSLCPNMGYPISGQTDFVPIRAARGRWDLEQTVFCISFLLLDSPQVHDREI